MKSKTYARHVNSVARRALVAYALALLAACGGGDPEPVTPEAAPEQPAPRAFARIVAIGNSITTHAPIPGLGWDGNHGMAAPTQAEDFVHLTAAALGVPVADARNVNWVENQPEAAMPLIPAIADLIPADALVIVKLGENVAPGDLEPFRQAYAALLDQAAKGAALVCVSTYWYDSAKDAVMRPECEARGGRWAYVGDLFDSPDNADRLTVEYQSAAVDNHPRAWGMRAMAERVVAAIK